MQACLEDTKSRVKWGDFDVAADHTQVTIHV